MLTHDILAHQAMLDAEEAHRRQRRKYSGEPYIRHPAEVAGIAAAAWARSHSTEVTLDVFLAVCWLHDVVEDNHRSIEWLKMRYPEIVANGVLFLTENKQGIRSVRKSEHNERIVLAPGWIKSIRLADMIANVRGLVGSAGVKDQLFVQLYLAEKRYLLKCLQGADHALLLAANSILQTEDALAALL